MYWLTFIHGLPLTRWFLLFLCQRRQSFLSVFGVRKNKTPLGNRMTPPSIKVGLCGQIRRQHNPISFVWTVIFMIFMIFMREAVLLLIQILNLIQDKETLCLCVSVLKDRFFSTQRHMCCPAKCKQRTRSSTEIFDEFIHWRLLSSWQKKSELWSFWFLWVPITKNKNLRKSVSSASSAC